MTKLVVVLLTSLLLVSIALTYELATRPKASGGFGEDTQVLGEVEYTLFKKGQDFPDLLFVFHGVIEGNGVWWPIAWSGEGVYYKLIVKNLITNGGANRTQESLFNSACTTCDAAEFIALTAEGSGASPTAIVCSGEITSGGLERAQATYTADSTPATGDVTPRISNTFVASASHTNVRKACLFTTIDSGVLFAQSVFTAANLNSGDQLTINWDLTYNG